MEEEEEEGGREFCGSILIYETGKLYNGAGKVGQ